MFFLWVGTEEPVVVLNSSRSLRKLNSWGLEIMFLQSDTFLLITSVAVIHSLPS